MEMWRFETKQFSIVWEIDDCFDLDLSWCETGETREKINSGEWQAFDSKVYVEWNGQEIGAAYLGQSIYANPEDFRDHIGRHGAALQARAEKELREAKEDFRKRIAYCQEKRRDGEWSHRSYIRSTQDAREAIREARKAYTHLSAMASRGGYGSSFSDMVREAIKEARNYLRGLDKPYVRAA